MTVERDRFIKIPVWLVVVLLPMAIALVTAYGINKASTAKIQMQVETQAKELEKKADKERIEQMNTRLDRMEDKLDRALLR